MAQNIKFIDYNDWAKTLYTRFGHNNIEFRNTSDLESFTAFLKGRGKNNLMVGKFNTITKDGFVLDRRDRDRNTENPT